MTVHKVAIIGCGVSGLSSIKSCLDGGLQPTCFEQQSWYGGVWRYCEKPELPNISSVHNSTVTNTCKVTTCFSDFPFPMEFPNYLNHRYLQKYLEMYASHFGLEKYIRFNTVVEKLAKSDDHEKTGKWVISYRKSKPSESKSNEIEHEIFDGVMVCNGRFWDQVYPKIPGMEKFKGVHIHSGDYRTFHPFVCKKVVVIGGAHSAADIACELSYHASQVYLSTRSGCYIFQRIAAKGYPNEMLLSRAVSILPWQIKKMFMTSFLNNHCDVGKFGLEPIGTFGTKKFPIVNDQLHHRIITGSIIVKNNIKEIRESSVLFSDGSVVEDVDVLVYATGFKMNYDFAKDIINVKHDYYVSLYKHIFLPEIKKNTLAVIGAVVASGALPPVYEMQSRVAAEVFTGRCKLPSKDFMIAEIVRREGNLQRRGVLKPHYMRVTFGFYFDELSEMIGAKPNLWSLLFNDPKLALHCIFGPYVPAQYRLQGPNSSKDAKKIILSTQEQYLTPLMTRKCQTLKSNRFIYFLIFALLVMVLAISIVFC